MRNKRPAPIRLVRALELAPPELVQRAREFASRTLADAGFGAFVHVLEVEIFNQWRAVADDDQGARALALLEGVRVFLEKLRELAPATKRD